MLRSLRALIGGLLLLGPAAVAAQTVAVDLNRAVFEWTAPVGGGAPTDYVMQCGAATAGPYPLQRIVAAPATTTPVLGVVLVPGTYFCVVTARNLFGVSAPSNEITFQAGAAPAAPSGLRVRVP